MRKLGTFELMRVWAAATGLALALWYFGALGLHKPALPFVAMLVTAIGGFEMALTGQDFLLKWRRSQG